MEWTRSETLALAQQSCTLCHGLGLRQGRSEVSTPCPCVFRAIFRACYNKFQECANKERRISQISLEANPGQQRKCVFGLKDEEYTADFCLVSRRSLSPGDYRIFKFHFLLGADWKLCCRRLNMDRGSFYHAVYRIQEKLGRIYRELRPYPLFPLDEYFHGIRHPDEDAPLFRLEKGTQLGRRLRFPVRKAA